MQNAPAMLAQKMMNRQAPYGPIGMVSQNMSGNKKQAAGSGALLGINFNTTASAAGVAFSNNSTTVVNNGSFTYTSAVSTGSTAIGATFAYFEFIIGSTADHKVGLASSSFVVNHADASNVTIGGAAAAYSFGYFPSGAFAGSFQSNGGSFGTGVTCVVGDVVGFQLEMTPTVMYVTMLKNNVVVINRFDMTATFGVNFNNTTSWLPAWSSRAIGCQSTISNSLYSYTGYPPITSPNTSALITASASVTPVADGAYDVYTFNASGTFTVASTGAVRALVIAGGGGSQGDGSGGAGAGGYQEKGIVATPQTYTVTVGAGASTGVGVNSSIAAAVVSNGGGSGGVGGTKNGGSGGGAYRDTVTNNAAGTGISGQGFAGGTVTFTGGATAYSHAGGGGAGAVGGNGTITAGGNGGAGITSSITGTAVARGGGGGGASFDGATDYAGTATAGGGFNFSGTNNGTANTGGGAGPSGLGGSGVVIIRVRARA